MLAAVDKTFEGFLEACIAAPDNCPLARDGRTVEDLKKIMADLFEQIKWNPIPFQGVVVDYTVVKNIIYSNLYVPSRYMNLSIAINNLLEGNLESLAEFAGSRQIPVQDQAILGIRCGDKQPKASSLEELQPTFEEYYATSEWFPDLTWGPSVLTCAQWNFEAKERYSGNFDVQTKEPILFIGNTYDPVTPWESAQNMSASFPGSVAVNHNGFGVSVPTTSHAT
jgi:hypothetical protein